MTVNDATSLRRQVTVAGIVQGVGFRPFLARLARELELAGSVRNGPAGVVVEVEGPAVLLDRFVERLRAEAPAAARIDSVAVADLAPADGARVRSFAILESVSGPGSTFVPPDLALCDACLAEVLDPSDRRYRHPFANCTACGPRYTVIERLPYDRATTTMARFPLCPACRAEYEDPSDRRYHAEPICCPSCGPVLSFVDEAGRTSGTDDALGRAQEVLAKGGIVAVKGVGGYHLACDGTSDRAVGRLRERKHRAAKPFAVMVRELSTAHLLAEIGPLEQAALRSSAAPIVLGRPREESPLSGLVAPGGGLVGVMLAYTALHHLLFLPVPGRARDLPPALVMTSGNLSDEPICTDDDDAQERLGGIADGFLVHDRPIASPCDDSVVRVVAGRVRPIRRSRGYAPVPLALGTDLPASIGVGGDLKSTFCLVDGRHAVVSQHLGDLESIEALAARQQAATRLVRLYRAEPSVAGIDAHPAYRSRRIGGTFGGSRVVEVQHHHAHVASVMAEHGLDGSEPVIGIAFDGTGFGTNRAGGAESWGGEVLCADYERAERLGHLRRLPLPGGDGAIRNPCRVALAYLVALDLPLDGARWPLEAMDETERRLVAAQVRRRAGCVETTSVGRLFDAVAALVGCCERSSFEAEAAMAVEAAAASWREGADPLDLPVGDDGVIDPEPALRAVLAGVGAGRPAGELALAFHLGLARAVADAATFAAGRVGPHPVVLAGGVFQNALLLEAATGALEAAGHRVLAPELLPANDGGLSLGQAVVAARAVR